MKKILPLLIAIACLHASCRRTIACYNTKHYEFQFYTPSIADTITDTSAMIVRYAKGSNFLSQVDTIKHITLSTDNTHYTGRYMQQYIAYTPYSGDMYTTDLLIILKPSGSQYRVTDISHDNRTLTEKNSDNYACSDDITYTVNGVTNLCPGQTFTSGGGDAILDIGY